MNILYRPAAAEVQPWQHFVLEGVGWGIYDKLLELLSDRPLQLNYDWRKLELLSPYPAHEVFKEFFSQFIDVLADVLSILYKALGSTTFRRKDSQRGPEPDACFYLVRAARVRSWRVIDLTVDPPPDLAIEVELSPPEADRMGIYAALGVPEPWRFNGETLRVCSLGPDKQYKDSSHSVNFPYLPVADVLPILERAYDT